MSRKIIDFHRIMHHNKPEECEPAQIDTIMSSLDTFHAALKAARLTDMSQVPVEQYEETMELLNDTLETIISLFSTAPTGPIGLLPVS